MEREEVKQTILVCFSDFKSNGVKLVIASAHADCSGRCSKWQGKVYSLDGSYGTTEDGREYQPLENATDVYYTTKAGRTYKNGLLGFNCRHKLHEFNGQQPQTISKEDRKKEYARFIYNYLCRLTVLCNDEIFAH